MHSTVTNLLIHRLVSITSIIYAKLILVLKPISMRTLNRNQITSTITESRIYTWNKKRRYR
ncbi:MAG: hypothetical protein ACJAZK_001247 [Psychroserpens sp.]|jgi:hypothetical protein